MRTEKEINERLLLKALLNEAVTTDGDHHKQWFLEKIADIFKVKLEEHEKGIAP